ncbi:P44 outermembrane protein, silent [Anaplasma phagocytophilum]|uniref:p44 outermembrane protein, silent n=1 Tax=Anaplasma phagocytophilum TaxID=948 RepID=A0A098EHG2_ANAPH|nr:P44 outermembrane protein, silent [Anaplasma phagocytophilum]
MMLLLGRLITLLLLLPRLLVKTSFSLLRLSESLILILISRFVRRGQEVVTLQTMVCMQKLLPLIRVVMGKLHYVEERDTIAAGVERLRSI